MAAELVEAMNMVKSFRVSDLQTLLASMGRSKSGLKQDLVGRALRLVQTEYSPELLKNVRQLYESRFPKATGWLPARRPEVVPVTQSTRSTSPSTNAQGTDYLNGLPKPSPTPASEIKLVSLPFYQTLETLVPPTELLAQNSEKLQDSPCVFELTQSQVDQIRNSSELRPGIKSVQVVLRICYTDTVGVQEDQYPPNIAVKVNQSYCHVPGYYPSNKPGVEPRRPCRPVNITPWLHLSTALNRITVTWGNFGKRYCVAVYLVRVFTAADLFSKLKLCSVESADRCRERIQDKLRFDPESEIATTGLRVSLICPLVKMRLNVPCRVLTCAHLQCFDAVFFLQMNEKKPTWTCPVCDKPAPFELLTIDGLLSEILKETEDVEEIEYLTDGSWRPIRDEKEKERERERSHTPEYPLLHICSPEANGHSPAPTSASQPAKSAAGTVAAPTGTGAGAVVDLTLDSSSEEEEADGPTGDSEDTDDSQDNPAPKRGRYAYDKDLVTAY
ncbi:E3 SUMO-protein ligase PIAS4-A-like isoform X1 [Brienomyrus brachyistius]|uniref:E3 SUMO-protein ligase PIAS4-A-like isoform X1 n=2 Tax=Brienomyrus brachyistius TaxID=42636 RepID=UPI0020B3C226|nr:E3 SUMO-protein ligase PIAS4-A-like isoform X1 [Brienomyrus brachyistius]